MPTSDFFGQYGFYAVRNFLDREFCTSVCKEIDDGPSKEGGVIPYGEAEPVEWEHFKRRLESDVSEETIKIVRGKLLDEIPALEKNYDVKLGGIQPLKFAKYRTGDFYKPHIDHFTAENTPDHVKDIPQSKISKERKVAAIAFFNSESEQPEDDTYCGGSLTFHGLMNDSPLGKFGLPLVGESGLLLTFPPSVMHEVTPITHGNRYSLATWYI